MARINPVADQDLDDETRKLLSKIENTWGQPWNITSTMAHNPAVLAAFLAINKALPRAGLSAMDREVICMEMAVANGCHYCVPAHRFAAREQGVEIAVIEQVAAGLTLEGDGRPAVIQRLTRRLAASRGKLSDQEFAGFQDLGITPAQMIAVVGEIALCTLTNTFNRLAETDLDPFLEPYRTNETAAQ